MKTANLPQRQSGVVLLIALVLLLLLTMIGLSSVQGVSMQENMAANLLEGNLSFQAAEAGLRAGEQQASALFAQGRLSEDTAGQAHQGQEDQFEGAAEKPSYAITQLASLRTSTQAGVPDDSEGILVQVESTGTGRTPQAVSVLRTTFLVEQ